MGNILYGKPVQQAILATVQHKVAQLGRQPRMATVGFADNAEWCSYVSSLAKSATSYNCIVDNSFVERNHEVMAQLVAKLNSDNTIDGIMIQQPLPREYDYIAQIISPNKDIDGVSTDNKLALVTGKESICPATPSAVIAMLEHYNIDIAGRKVAVIGRGVAVGKPLMLMLLNRNATITVCHSRSQDIASVCSRCDVVVSACGVANLVDSSYINSDATVIDVGTNFVDGKLCGDVCFANVVDNCSAISPVPGGIGPVTRACLFVNLVHCALNREV